MDWKNDWSIDVSVSKQSGGQGTVSKVIRKSDGTKGALKELHLQFLGNSERRQRMAIEVSALIKMAGRGVPLIYDHNMDSVADKNIQLYFISQWIEGNTLQNVVNGRPQELNKALKLTRRLTEIIQLCHIENVYHRDIKPNNIIFETLSNELYLVDFGLAFSLEEDDLQITSNRQELGNRFLRLPELGSGQEKRDPRADLTFLVGIFYFLLTGRAPNSLIDAYGNPPHKRNDGILPVSIISNPKWNRIKSIFDIGFSTNWNYRFQNAKDIIQKIDEVISYVPAGPETSLTYLTELNQLTRLRETIDFSIDIIEKTLITTLNKLAISIKILCLEHGFKQINPSAQIVKLGREARILWKVCHSNSAEPYVFVYLFATLEGENKSNVSIRLETADSERIVKDCQIFYNGPFADLDRLDEEIQLKSSEFFALAIKLLRMKIEIVSLQT